MWGNATLAMAVSRSSMNVARVTTTATIQGLIAGRPAVTCGNGMEAVAELISGSAPFEREETVHQVETVFMGVVRVTKAAPPIPCRLPAEFGKCWKIREAFGLGPGERSSLSSASRAEISPR
jgi:hypothetical protein